MAGKSEEAELSSLLTVAEQAIARAIHEAGIDAEVAAAACAALAGEYTAAAAKAQGLPLAPLLSEAKRALVRRARRRSGPFRAGASKIMP
jgi:hypothetical protein